MKKSILVILLLTIISSTYSQTNIYQPFPTDSARWFREYGTNYGTTYASKTWLGDTVINGKTYTKGVDEDYPFPLGIFPIGIRQDIPNEKVYSIDINGIETDISVNQHLDSGAMIPVRIWGCTDSSMITGVDSVLINGQYRKAYHLSSTAMCQGLYVMGIGIVQSNGWEWGSNIICFSVKNTILYGGGGQYCYITTGISENKDENENIAVSPNPCKDNIIFDIPFSMLGGTLKIYNLWGMEILDHNINAQILQIDLNYLPKGIFIAELRSKSTFSIKKIIKE